MKIINILIGLIYITLNNLVFSNKPEIKLITPLSILSKYRNSSKSINGTIFLNSTNTSSIINHTKNIFLLSIIQLCIYRPSKCKEFLKRISGKLDNLRQYDFIDIYEKGGISDVSWQDVVGLDNSVTEMRRILTRIILQKSNNISGVVATKNILLVGPPGTGKTLLARASAKELGVPLLVVSGSEIVKGKYAGIGVERIKLLFMIARHYSKKSAERISIIFIDELDSCGRRRGDESALGRDQDNTLNQLLIELDGYSVRDNLEHSVIVISATNRRDVLDPALTRKGRFDNILHINRPNVKGRRALFYHYIQKHGVSTLSYETESNISLIESIDILARLSSGLVGADIYAISNEATYSAIEDNRKFATHADYLHVLEDTILGKPIYNYNDPEKPPPDWRVAIHESGHILTSFFLKNVENATRASIVPRLGGSLGVTMFYSGDSSNLRSSQLREYLVMMLGGKMAEYYIFDGDISTGAEDDVKRAYELAEGIVTRFAMNGIEYVISDNTSYEMIRKELILAEKKSYEYVSKYGDKLLELANNLMLYETLNESKIREILNI
tara:strand:- start:1791 stop:3464 length:1674 start_codon:yes stop_codon:yes gene_type:complete